MLGNKFIFLFVMWLVIIGTYVVIGFFMPAINDITAVAQTELNASANMSHFPGVIEAVQMYPVFFVWFVPGLVGIILTVIELKRG